jgi:hypothetical protein
MAHHWPLVRLLALGGWVAVSLLVGLAAAEDCECTCCQGSGCAPTYQGAVGVASCAECTIQACRNNFSPACPVAGSGSISASCNTGVAVGIIVGCVLGVLVLVGAIVAFVVWRKRKAAASAAREGQGLLAGDRPAANVVYAPTTGYAPPPPPQQQSGYYPPLQQQGGAYYPKQ